MRGTKRKHADVSEGESPLKKAKVEPLDVVSFSDEADSVDSNPKDDETKLGKFSKFRISKSTRKTLKERGIKFLFPIQYLTFDHVYDGKDVIGQARTGTGKTLSFALPLLEKLAAEGAFRNSPCRPPLILVMAPTRELSKQVHSEFKALACEDLASYCIYGGTPYEPQENAIRRGIDILVGTPGRILDQMNRGALNLSQLRHVVLDEADQMLERGFAETVEEILQASFANTHGPKPQLLLFSATVPSWVKETAKRYMTGDHVLVDLIGRQTTRTAVTVEHKAVCCPYSERPSTIADIVQVYSGAHGRTMVFCQTKTDANELALSSELKQDCQVLHGDIQQRQRELTLKGFRSGKFQVLVATDVAARGLDVPEVDLVIQCEPPKVVDSYIHRSGRTGRAGRTGVSILFYKPQQEQLVRCVELKAGVQFMRIGAPQAVDIIKAGARDAIRSLEEVPESVLPHFHEAAEQLVQEKGATGIVAAALAYISGAREITSRSLLSSHQGYVTYHLQSDEEVRHVSYFWKVLESCFPPAAKGAVKGMRMCKDSRGVVFDIPSTFSATIKEQWQDGFVKLVIPTSLPELMERPSNYFDRQARPNQGHGRSNGHHFSAGSSWNGQVRRTAFNGQRRGFVGQRKRFT